MRPAYPLLRCRDEAFTFSRGQKKFLPHLSEKQNLFPYLLVNIGSGVSILRVRPARTLSFLVGPAASAPAAQHEDVTKRLSSKQALFCAVYGGLHLQ